MLLEQAAKYRTTRLEIQLDGWTFKLGCQPALFLCGVLNPLPKDALLPNVSSAGLHERGLVTSGKP